MTNKQVKAIKRLIAQCKSQGIEVDNFKKEYLYLGIQEASKLIDMLSKKLSNSFNKKKFREVARIEFGKYAGEAWSDIPTDYLIWFVKNGYAHMVNRKRAALKELEKRGLIKVISIDDITFKEERDPNIINYH